MKTAELYNLKMIEQMTKGNSEQIKTFISLFLRQTPQQVAEMKKAYQSGDLETLNHIAHKMKPTLAYYGINALLEDILRIETESAAGVQVPEQLLQKVETVIGQVGDKMKIDFYQ